MKTATIPSLHVEPVLRKGNWVRITYAAFWIVWTQPV